MENPDYDIECVEASIPPWPICLFHNVTYFVDSAISSASRCCDFGNLEECTCPVKFKKKWKVVMKQWCPKIATCPIPEGGVKFALVTETWSDALMSEMDKAHEMMDGYDEEDEDDE